MGDPLSGPAIKARLDALAAFTDVPGQIHRLTLGPAHARAAAEVAGWYAAAGGRNIRLTGLGDMRARFGPGHAKAVVIGSHIDSVVDAGAYDGTLGVVTGLAIAEALAAEGWPLPFDLELVAFADEEGVRFPTTLTGARAAAGRHDPKVFDDTDREGVTRRAALEAFGVLPSWNPADSFDPAVTLAYLEAHIEQGPVLERRGAALGVVTGIAGASRGRVIVTGVAGHAGTLPMAMRHDAMAAAAEMILAAEALARPANTGLVATIGQVAIPGGGAVNVVPGATEFSYDIRAPDDVTRRAAVETLKLQWADIAARRGVAVDVQERHEQAAAPCDPALRAALGDAIVAAGLPKVELMSGAGHDAMAFSGRVPFAMLFLRCRDGISHNPAEFCAEPDMELAARVLKDALTRLGDAP